jgi:hypothetical protein
MPIDRNPDQDQKPCPIKPDRWIEAKASASPSSISMPGTTRPFTRGPDLPVSVDCGEEQVRSPDVFPTARDDFRYLVRFASGHREVGPSEDRSDLYGPWPTLRADQLCPWMWNFQPQSLASRMPLSLHTTEPVPHTHSPHRPRRACRCLRLRSRRPGNALHPAPAAQLGDRNCEYQNHFCRNSCI